MPATGTVSETSIPGLKMVHRGKVRDVYEVDADRLLLVATDRISAFDCILPNPIPHKGAILTALSVFWFGLLEEFVPNHLISADPDRLPDAVRNDPALRHRSLLVRRTKVFPVECVVRGYVEGSAWKDYQSSGEICGHRLPTGLVQCAALPEPIFTPATKAPTGHDQNISESELADIVGAGTAAKLKELSLGIYARASEHAARRGIIIADTKFEFGLDRDGRIILIDEVLTPDSSRFWSASTYSPGSAQASFDKQFVREYLESLDWDKLPPAPPLPPEIIEATTARYLEALRILAGMTLQPDGRSKELK